MTRAARHVEIALVLQFGAGCAAFGPSALETSRLQYNEVATVTRDPAGKAGPGPVLTLPVGGR
jgi:hypothetical protein